VQYASADYQRVLAAHGVVASMSRRGDCWDNAVAESFFSTLKSELATRRWPSRGTAAAALSAYIDGFYNPVRLHSTLDYQAPSVFESLAAMSPVCPRKRINSRKPFVFSVQPLLLCFSV
jgi:transposase InsO family protein